MGRVRCPAVDARVIRRSDTQDRVGAVALDRRDEQVVPVLRATPVARAPLAARPPHRLRRSAAQPHRQQRGAGGKEKFCVGRPQHERIRRNREARSHSSSLQFVDEIPFRRPVGWGARASNDPALSNDGDVLRVWKLSEPVAAREVPKGEPRGLHPGRPWLRIPRKTEPLGVDLARLLEDQVTPFDGRSIQADSERALRARDPEVRVAQTCDLYTMGQKNELPRAHRRDASTGGAGPSRRNRAASAAGIRKGHPRRLRRGEGLATAPHGN
jgi:hypothetical protein